MCKICTEAVHCVALWTRTLSQVWACVKYVPKITEAVHCIALWVRGWLLNRVPISTPAGAIFVSEHDTKLRNTLSSVQMGDRTSNECSRVNISAIIKCELSYCKDSVECYSALAYLSQVFHGVPRQLKALECIQTSLSGIESVGLGVGRSRAFGIYLPTWHFGCFCWFGWFVSVNLVVASSCKLQVYGVLCHVALL